MGTPISIAGSSEWPIGMGAGARVSYYHMIYHRFIRSRVIGPNGGCILGLQTKYTLLAYLADVEDRKQCCGPSGSEP